MKKWKLHFFWKIYTPQRRSEGGILGVITSPPGILGVIPLSPRISGVILEILGGNFPPPLESQEGTRDQKGEISLDISISKFQAKTAL